MTTGISTVNLIGDIETVDNFHTCEVKEYVIKVKIFRY